MDRNMDVQHGHEAWTCTCAMDMEMDKHHGCRNAGIPIQCLVCHRKSSVSLQNLVWHRHSGIVVSPVPLVTD